MSDSDLSPLFDALSVAVADGKLTESAVKNIRHWLSSPAHAAYVPEIAEHITAGQWQVLDDVFWTIIPFGTGGRRGRMYPIGSNAINERTIGESAQGLANYVRSVLGPDATLSCAIAYDYAASVDRVFTPFVPKCWRRPGLLFICSMAIAARPSCRLRCERNNAVAASWSRPATIRPATMRSKSIGRPAASFCRRTIGA